MKVWLVLKNNYVIDRVLWDGETEWQYPGEHDYLIEDVYEEVAIGSWYEESEDVFYRSYRKPVDESLPEEIGHLWD